jgi:hypothetical protein
MEGEGSGAKAAVLAAVGMFRPPDVGRRGCWWRSGSKGNSPLSSFPPFAYYYEATSTTRVRKGIAETLNSTKNEIRKYSADRRPKD